MHNKTNSHVKTESDVVCGAAGIQRSSSQHSGLSMSRGKGKQPDSQDRDRVSGDQTGGAPQDRNRVPLEALVRKSSPIAVAKKEEPAEPQVCLPAQTCVQHVDAQQILQNCRRLQYSQSFAAVSERSSLLGTGTVSMRFFNSQAKSHLHNKLQLVLQVRVRFYLLSKI